MSKRNVSSVSRMEAREPHPEGDRPAELSTSAARSGENGLVWMRPERRSQAPSLSREQIVRAAIDIADAEGLQGVSMRRIAARLGSGTMSLYWYVSNKEELFDLMLDAVLGESELPEQPSGDWRADLRLVAYQTREALRRHPWVASIAAGRPSLGPNMLRRFEFSLSAMDGLGLDIGPMVGMVNVVQDYVMGFVLQELAEKEAERRTGLTEQQWHAAVEPYMRKVIATGRYPQLARFVLEMDEPSDDQKFAYGVECVLDGVAARVEGRATGP